MEKNLANISLYNQDKNDSIVKLLKYNHNINLGDNCSISILSKYDNMNYYGVEGTKDILNDIINKIDYNKLITFIDAGPDMEVLQE